MEEDLEINDPRVEFLADYVLKTMKLRADRWLKMYAVEANKQLCLEFFDKVYLSLHVYYCIACHTENKL